MWSKTDRTRFENIIRQGLLWDLVVLFFLGPYFRDAAKICFWTAFVLWTALTILRLGKNFYRAMVPHTFLNIPILIFMGAAAVSVMFSTDFRHSQSVFFERYVPFMLWFWIAVGTVREFPENVRAKAVSLRSIYLIAAGLVFSALVTGIGGIRDYICYRPVRLFTAYGRSVLFNMFPLYLVYLLPVTYTFAFFSRKRWLRVFSVCAFITVFLCWVWQGCRIAWIAVPVTLFVITFLRNRRMGIVLFLLFVLLFSLFSPAQLARARKIFTYQEWSVPRQVWSIAFFIWKDRPLLGGGVGTYEHLMVPYGKRLGYTPYYLHAHSVYFETASEMGLLGMGLLFYLFYVFFRQVYIRRPALDHELQTFLLGFAGAVMAALLMGLWASIILVGFAGSSMFWVLLGLGVAVAESAPPVPFLPKSDA